MELDMRLNHLLSSSNFSLFFINQFLSFDLMERRLSDFENFYNYYVRSNKNLLTVKFELTLPFLNDLGRFRNRVLILLHFLIFELMVGVKPLVSPVMVHSSSFEKDINIVGKKYSKRLRSLLSSSPIQRIDRFIFRRDLGISQSSFFLMTVACFLSRHTYSLYTVPSRLIKSVNSSNSYRFKLSPGFSNLDFLSQFDEFILSRVSISFSFSKKFSNQLFHYFLYSLGLNLNNNISKITTYFSTASTSFIGASSIDSPVTTINTDLALMVPLRNI